MKKYLIITLIVVMMFAQTVSAEDAGGTAPCAQPTIVITDGISIADDKPGSMNGIQVYPGTPQCLGVTKCTATPASDCMLEGGSEMCQYASNGTDVGVETGLYCLNPSHEVVLCTFTGASCSNDSCAYNISGNWIGVNKGGYTYDTDDGYKMGVKTVTVNVTINATDGVKVICTGSVKMVVDNYDLKNSKEITLNPVAGNTCDSTQVGTWTGNFTMHYWEKPGWYRVAVDVVSSCGKGVKGNQLFQYLEQEGMCITPPGRMMQYTDLIGDQYSTAIGDVITSNCTQCDIGSAPQTIRNTGNTVFNAYVSSGDLNCVSGACMNNALYPKMPSEKNDDKGRLYIDLGNDGYHKLWNSSKYMRLTPQAYCKQNVTTGCPSCSGTELQAIYGLPPGPHATNILNLKVSVPANVMSGSYRQTISITPQRTATCCEDHREIDWNVDGSSCITPPECYEQLRYCTQIDTTPGSCNQLATAAYNYPDNVCAPAGGINHQVSEPSS